jgi:hypothetical protein
MREIDRLAGGRAVRAGMKEHLAAWRTHCADAESGKVAADGRYLGLPSWFVDTYPPLLQLGDAAAGARPIVLVSLEPLLDPRNFDHQLRYLSADKPEPPSWRTMDAERCERMQLEFWEVFPEIMRRAGTETTPYWRKLHELVLGILGMPAGTPFSWDTFREASFIELPLVPMHARVHRGVDEPLLSIAASLLGQRLEWLRDHHPAGPLMVIGLGGDVLRALRAMGAMTEVDALRGEADHPYGVNFDGRWPVSVCRFVPWRDSCTPFFLRGAPFTTGNQPRGPGGVYALGSLMRAAAARFSEHAPDRA